jgi:hypothetical protein
MRCLCAAAPALVLAAAMPARAQHLASDQRWEVRAALTAAWIGSTEATSYQTSPGGVASLDVGVAFRITPGTAIAAFARAGFFHAGGGLEFDWTPADWGQSGLVLRLAPTLLYDDRTCRDSASGANPGCSSALFAQLELGAGYRWAFRSTAGVTIGGSLSGGYAWARRDGLPTEKLGTFGVWLPRLAVDF